MRRGGKERDGYGDWAAATRGGAGRMYLCVYDKYGDAVDLIDHLLLLLVVQAHEAERDRPSDNQPEQRERRHVAQVRARRNVIPIERAARNRTVNRAAQEPVLGCARCQEGRKDRSSAVVDFFAPRIRTRLRTRTVVVCRLRMEPLLFLKTLPKGVQIGLRGLVFVSLSTTSTLTCASQVATDPDCTRWNGLVCASGFVCSSRNPSIVVCGMAAWGTTHDVCSRPCSRVFGALIPGAKIKTEAPPAKGKGKRGRARGDRATHT